MQKVYFLHHCVKPCIVSDPVVFVPSIHVFARIVAVLHKLLLDKEIWKCIISIVDIINIII